MKRIVDAAARLFGREGFQRASMLQVARAAGVSKGLLHYHFRSKEHLLIEAQRATFLQINRRFEERYQRGERGLIPAADAFEALWTALLDMKGWAPFMVEVLSMTTHDDELRQHAEEFHDEVMALLIKGIRQLFSDDLDALRIPPDRVARLIHTTLCGLVVDLAQARTPAEVEMVNQTAEDFKVHVISTLYRKQEGKP